MNCLYVFIDESGNLDFSPRGTKYFVLSAVTATEPIESSNKLQKLKYNLLAEGGGGMEYQNFHASEDKQKVRDDVFSCISKMKSIKVNYIVAEKRMTHPKYHNSSFYSLLGSAITKYLLLKYKISSYDKIVIVFDQILTRNEQDNFLKQVKPTMKEIGKPYAIYFHRTMSDFNGQIADYCAWAKYVELERGETRPMQELNNINKTVFDIFGKGDTYYY